ncbi:tRNA (adenosine(37)-N6)-threonylcarbamoyltransferase complex ATPase subunit type 1 TsaE [bacterium]|nr:tRNA (adenosine(37)-N6)-threonylcarbamoyltransferase complex ATPase subunit type 1 TsaE [bacterium]
MHIREIKTANWEETFRVGKNLAAFLKAGDIVALYGDLGSGKTILTKGLCSGLNVREMVTSPTFTLIQEYTGTLPVYHFDFYRLSSSDEVEMLDLDAYFGAGGVSVIEWADRAESLLPASLFRIYLDRSTAADSMPGPDTDMRSLKIVGPEGCPLDRLNL